jgi:hypothetical protein
MMRESTAGNEATYPGGRKGCSAARRCWTCRTAMLKFVPVSYHASPGQRLVAARLEIVEQESTRRSACAHTGLAWHHPSAAAVISPGPGPPGQPRADPGAHPAAFSSSATAAGSMISRDSLSRPGAGQPEGPRLRDPGGAGSPGRSRSASEGRIRRIAGPEFDRWSKKFSGRCCVEKSADGSTGHLDRVGLPAEG